MSATEESLLESPTVLKETYKHGTRRSFPFCGEESLKRACRPVFNLCLKEFLEKTITGKYILQTYERE